MGPKVFQTRHWCNDKMAKRLRMYQRRLYDLYPTLDWLPDEEEKSWLGLTLSNFFFVVTLAARKPT
jgi:hypothetical protein